MPDTRHENTEDERGVASRQRPVLIGVTGGIGSGKSTVIDRFVQHGAARFSADEAVHALYATDEVRDAVTARWGNRVLASDGTIDRSVIAAIIFPDAAERIWLEGLLHPLVARAWLRFVYEAGDHSRGGPGGASGTGGTDGTG
ncbi:MAG: dephospho-CoA kinase, partial [Thermoleophilia bacterium]|nr:dephospho-CoA kinase [Thermoleophilia bacterium]